MLRRWLSASSLLVPYLAGCFMSTSSTDKPVSERWYLQNPNRVTPPPQWTPPSSPLQSLRWFLQCGGRGFSGRRFQTCYAMLFLTSSIPLHKGDTQKENQDLKNSLSLLEPGSLMRISVVKQEEFNCKIWQDYVSWMVRANDNKSIFRKCWRADNVHKKHYISLGE